MRARKTSREVCRPGINRIIEIAAGIVAELLNYLLAAAFAVTLTADLVKSDIDWRSICFLGLVPLLNYLFREKVKYLVFFLFLHLLPPVGILVFYQGSIGQKLILFLLAFFFSAVSMVKRMKGSGSEMEAALPPVAAGGFWVLYLLDASQGEGKLGVPLLYGVICFMAGYFIYYFLRQFLHYIDVNNRTTENIPVDHVFYSAAGLASGFICIMTAITVAISDRELLDEAGAAISRMIAKGITFLFSLLPKGSTNMGVTANMGGGSINFEEIVGAATEKSLFMEIVDILLYMAGVVILVTILFKTVVNVVRLIRDGFAREKKSRKIENGSQEDLIENLKKEKREQKHKGNTSLLENMERLLSPEEKIRRIYRRTLRKSVPSWEGEKKQQLFQKATARECCMALFPENEKAATAFAGLYEKARYGQGCCHSEDVKEARRLAQLLQA